MQDMWKAPNYRSHTEKGECANYSKGYLSA